MNSIELIQKYKEEYPEIEVLIDYARRRNRDIDFGDIREKFILFLLNELRSYTKLTCTAGQGIDGIQMDVVPKEVDHFTAMRFGMSKGIQPSTLMYPPNMIP